MSMEFGLCFEGRLSEELRSSGAAVHDLGEVHASRPWTVWRARRRLAALLTRERFDAAICHMPWSLWALGPAVKSSQTSLAFWVHGTATGDHWTERWASRTRPQLAICNSHFTAHSLPNLFPSVPMDVLYCPVAAPPREAANCRAAVRHELGVEDDAVVVIQVSRLEPWKGHTLHLQALSLLRDNPTWRCWMVGGAQRKEEQAYLERLRALAAESGIAERVQFLGQRGDVARLLAAADIHCQPNTGPEPFGIAFIEALQNKLPVVTTAIGGAKEILDETCALLASPDDPAELALLLGQLIESPALRERLGRGGPARARRLCDPGTQINHLHDVLANMLQERARYVH